ncbi:hypothetical protein GGF32_007452 [Allomyces javanicus]|nr:hypothetical protein GGF32_007452 [Allomyces javanicus]
MQALHPTTPSRPLDDLVKLDHRSFNELHARYKASVGDQRAQTAIANELIREIAQHSAGEEMTFYAAVQEHESTQLADHLRGAHQGVKEMLYTLESRQVGSAEYDLLLDQVMTELNTHALEEENQVLPTLRAQIGEDNMIQLGKKFLGAKRMAPTHPHPSAPDKPVTEAIAGAMTTPLDKLRDMPREFAERRVPEE